jgi:hypothetical protein
LFLLKCIGIYRTYIKACGVQEKKGIISLNDYFSVFLRLPFKKHKYPQNRKLTYEICEHVALFGSCGKRKQDVRRVQWGKGVGAKLDDSK